MAEAHRIEVNGNIFVFVNYNASNLRIQDVEWVIPPEAGVTVRARIWDGPTLIYETVETVSGSNNVPGNHQMVEDPEEPGYYEIPFDYRFEVY